MSTYKKICITNRKLVDGDFLKQIEKLASGDIDLFILREKDLPEEEYEELAAKMIDICRVHGKMVMLHTFQEAAKRLNHPFIHLTMTDFMELSDEDRRWFEKIGVSTHSAKEAIICEKRGASYVTASHIFPTDCKPGIRPKGLVYLKEVTGAVGDMEVYALGGINEENMQLCIEAGADGVCMMSEYMRR